MSFLSTQALRAEFIATRARTVALAAPLSAEDQLVQSMPECSPTKWHRAHTSWFFETFFLGAAGRPPRDPQRSFLWNSYYEAVGGRHPRSQRGLLSRPSLAEVADYRREIDARVLEVLDGADDALTARLAPILSIGLAHEQQHQELILTDILHALSCHPFAPVYTRLPDETLDILAENPGGPPRFTTHDGGLVDIGHGGGAFAFDNEGPRHKVWLEPFAINDRPITVGEMKAFIADGGYRTPSLWLSSGWDFVQSQQINTPLHATMADGTYRVFTLHGQMNPPDEAPASHLSHYEADAVARWLGGRLPTEFEWEHAAASAPPDQGHFAEDRGCLTPTATGGTSPFGGVWQWTSSAYAPYPRFAPGLGAIGEYNGKFMANQYVLRGGSCLTPPGHIRLSYRNFWPSATRFQMTGARVVKDRL